MEAPRPASLLGLPDELLLDIVRQVPDATAESRLVCTRLTALTNDIFTEYNRVLGPQVRGGPVEGLSPLSSFTNMMNRLHAEASAYSCDRAFPDPRLNRECGHAVRFSGEVSRKRKLLQDEGRGKFLTTVAQKGAVNLTEFEPGQPLDVDRAWKWLRPQVNFTEMKIGVNVLLPQWIGDLTSLTSLEIGNNCYLQQLPDISSLTNLEGLDLFINRSLEELPDSLSSVSSLTKLSVFNCASFKRLPSLPQMKTLVLGKIPKFTDISVLASYKKLTVLSLNNLNVQKICMIFELQLLEELSLNFLTLHEIDDDLGLLSNLRKLSLSNNKLNKLPITIGKLEKLQCLEATDNWIQEIPCTVGLLGCLQKLDLSNNQIKVVPRELTTCSSLVEIALRNNLITPENFPRFLARMSSTGLLNLCGNPGIDLSISTFAYIKREHSS